MWKARVWQAHITLDVTLGIAVCIHVTCENSPTYSPSSVPLQAAVSMSSGSHHIEEQGAVSHSPWPGDQAAGLKDCDPCNGSQDLSAALRGFVSSCCV